MPIVVSFNYAFAFLAIIDRDRLLKVLFSFNPWWITGTVPKESTKSENLCFFFDEVHYAGQWDLWLKYLYDHRKSCKVIATGSASPVLVAHTAESGVGRWTIIRIPTLSFYEYWE